MENSSSVVGAGFASLRRSNSASISVVTASGKAIEFAGFRRAYVEGSDDPAAELERMALPVARGGPGQLTEPTG